MSLPPVMANDQVSLAALPWTRRSRTLFLGAFLTVALVAASVQVAQVVAAYRDVEQRALRTSAEMATGLAAATEALVGQHVRVVQTVADAVFQQQVPAEARHRLLERVRARQPEIDGVIVLNSDGVVVDADAGAAQLVGRNLSDRVYYRRIVEGASTVVGDLILSKASGIASIPVAVAGRTAGGELLGLVVLGVRSATLGRHLELRLSHGAFPVLVDRSGRLVFHGAFPELAWAQRDYRAVPAVADALTGRLAFWTGHPSPVTGEPRVGALAPVASLGWAAGVLQPVDAALAPAHAELRRAILATAAVVGVATGLAVLLGLWLAQPVTALSRAVHALAAGHLAHRVTLRSRTEFGWLGHAFNQMAARLEESRRQERALNDELTAANEELQANMQQLEESMAEVEASRARAEASAAEVRAVAAELQAQASTLDAERSRFEAVLQHLPAGVIVAESPTGRILLRNPKAAEILGRPAGGSAPEGAPPAAPGADVLFTRTGPLARVLASGEVVSEEEVAIHRADGSDAVLRVSAGPIRGPDGQMVAAVATFRDITERKAIEAALRSTEEQLRQAQKMEAVGLLAGGVAHDFNNLLTAITGYSELLLRQHADGQAAKDLEEIRGAAERAANLTRQLLAFSRQQVLEPKTLDLNPVVSNVQKMLGRLIGEDIELVVELDPALARVRADRSQLEQVILNLAVNARDAMPDGGTLTIETTNVTLDEGYVEGHLAVQPGPYVLLAVTDTGSGMTPEVQRHIFEPFFTTKPPGVGTGLGLSTVYGIVKQSGGHVWVYSEPGKGTTFKVYLPQASDAGDTPVARRTRVKPRGGGETVLLVEDEQAVRALARRVLESAGYAVLEAANGEEAAEISRTHSGTIELMVTDVVMRGRSGPELASDLMHVRPELRVLFMSGYTDRVARQRALLRPGTPFLNKPFTPDTLAQKVRDVLDGA